MMGDEENICELLNTSVKLQIENYYLVAIYNNLIHQCFIADCQQCHGHSTPVTSEVVNAGEDVQAEMFGKIVTTLFCTNYRRCVYCQETVQLIRDFEAKEG